MPFTRIRLDPRSDVPLHDQLASALRELIHSGRLRPRQSLPPELALVRDLGVSRHTVRHALAELVAKG